MQVRARSGAVLDRALDLPVLRWRYTGARTEGEQLGPIAEDFHAAFDLGADTRSISTVDGTGVALAAVQGLHARATAEQLALARRLDALEARFGRAARAAPPSSDPAPVSTAKGH